MSTDPRRPSDAWAIILGALTGIAVALASPPVARGMDHGFDKSSPTVQWFESLIRPDSPPNSCCGLADAYPVGKIERRPSEHIVRVWVLDGSAMAYPDGTYRQAWDASIPIDVPDYKLNTIEERERNPTNLGWVFFRPSSETEVGAIYCLVIGPDLS